MEFQAYFRILRRWLWLVIAAAIVTGGIAFMLNANRVTLYRAQATLMIGTFIESPNPNYSDIRTGIDLATTYVELVATRPILQGAVDALGLDIPAEFLGGFVSARSVENTSLIVITVTYTDPVLVSDIANAVAEELVSQSPTNLTAEQQGQIAFLNGQLEILNVLVEELQQRLIQIASELEVATDSAEISRLAQERDTALEQFNQAQGNIAQFASTIAQIQQRINSIQIVEEASPLAIPIVSGGSANVVLGAALGAVAAFVVAVIIEYIDDTIRNTEDATRVLGLPILGTIVRYGNKARAYKDMLMTRFPPMSPIQEGYRAARTNVLYTVAKGETGVFVVTSANPQEGKTVTASNLAISMAMSGLSVILIDADLRRPRLHETFMLENTVGLTTLLFSDPDTEPTENGAGDVEFPSLPKSFRECVQHSGIGKLYILTSGFIPSNPNEILASASMAKWVEVLRKSPDIHVIIFDSPPTLAAADSAVLAANVDAKVIMVVDRGSTRFGAAKRTKEQFAQLDVPILGIIMNRFNPRDENYGYHYGYYYTPEVGQPKQSGWRRLLNRPKDQ